MHETADDLAALQALLDRSYEAAGVHLRRVITPERRMTAAEVAGRLQGMSLLSLATVTAAGRPVIGPVDGILYRGALHFGSAGDSVRFRHIRRRPQVSACHLPGEELQVTVHGRATVLDLTAADHAGLRRTILDIYVPRYGAQWEEFMDQGTYARIDADRMFTFQFTPEQQATGGQ